MFNTLFVSNFFSISFLKDSTLLVKIKSTLWMISLFDISNFWLNLSILSFIFFISLICWFLNIWNEFISPFAKSKNVLKLLNLQLYPISPGTSKLSIIALSYLYKEESIIFLYCKNLVLFSVISSFNLSLILYNSSTFSWSIFVTLNNPNKSFTLFENSLNLGLYSFSIFSIFSFNFDILEFIDVSIFFKS